MLIYLRTYPLSVSCKEGDKCSLDADDCDRPGNGHTCAGDDDQDEDEAATSSTSVLPTKHTSRGEEVVNPYEFGADLIIIICRVTQDVEEDSS